jgi:hypothetical protein
VPGKLTAKQISWCGSMDSEQRRRWSSTLGLLDPGPDFSEFDAVLTAVAAALIAGSTSHRAREAFTPLMPAFRTAYLAGRRDLWAIVPKEGKDFRFAESASSAAHQLAQVGLGWAVPLRDPIERAVDRYAKALDSGPAAPVRVLHGANSRTSRGA